MLHHTQTVFLALLFALCLIGLSIFDLRKRNKVLLYWAPCAVQFLMIPIIGVYFPHYYYPIIPFLFAWLFYPRNGIGKNIALTAISILIIRGLFTLNQLLTIL